MRPVILVIAVVLALPLGLYLRPLLSEDTIQSSPQPVTQPTASKIAEQTWDNTQQTAGEAWEKTQDASGETWDNAQDATGEAWDNVSETTEEVWDGTATEEPIDDAPAAESAWQRAMKESREALEATGDAAGETWNVTKEVAGETWETTREVGSETWETTQEKSDKLWDITKETSGGMWRSLSSGANRAGSLLWGEEPPPSQEPPSAPQTDAQ